MSEAQTDSVLVELWSHGTTGIVEEDDYSLRAYFEERSSLDSVAQLFPGLVHATQQEPEWDPASIPLESCDPILVGERFFISSGAADIRPPPGRFRLAVQATTAFGTGRHETTQLCIQALEKWLVPDSIVLDIGCGSGILSMAAGHLGVRQVVSCDIDPSAIETAKQHLDTPLFMGSVDAVRRAFADLTIANLTQASLDRLSHELKRVTKPEGQLLISGFLKDAPPKNFLPEKTWELNDWLCWMCRAENVLEVDSSPSREPIHHPKRWWL